jgi:hypothetical protein
MLGTAIAARRPTKPTTIISSTSVKPALLDLAIIISLVFLPLARRAAWRGLAVTYGSSRIGLVPRHQQKASSPNAILGTESRPE